MNETTPSRHDSQKSLQNADDAIVFEQTELLYKAMPLSLITSFINVIILSGLINHHVDQTLLSVWFGIAFIVTVGRGFLWLAYRNASIEQRKNKKWTDYFNNGVIVAGFSWSLASLLLFPESDIVSQTFLAFIVAGISAASVTSLAYIRFSIVVFLSLLLLPLSIRFLANSSDVSLAMGFLALLFYVFNLRNANQVFKNTRQNILLRMQAVQRENNLRESEETSRTLVNSVPVGVMRYDQHGVIRNCNATLSNITGVPADQILEYNLITDTAHDDEFFHAISASLNNKNGYFLGRTKIFGQSRAIKIRAITRALINAEGNISGGVCVIDDLSEEDRIEKLKTEFVSVVSHELRTPLTAIIGSLKLINSGVIAVTDSRAEQMIDMALNNANRLHELINDILDINKLENNSFNLSEYGIIDLMQLARETIEANKALEVSHRVHLCFDPLSEQANIRGDASRLQQALNNLISNAAKFSPDNGMILIAVNKHEDSAIVSVSDQGPGISHSLHEKIFEKFFQIDSSAERNHGGTGLGLSIAKFIVSQHKGKISITSQEGAGATFTIELPLCSEALKQAS